MIEIVNLTKRFGNKLAVDNVSFTVDKGEIVGFLGPNGAGKTTTMNIITGYLSSTSGSCRVENFDVLKNPEQVKQKIGYLPENPPLYLDMTVFDYLNFVYDLKKIKNDRQSHLKDIMETVKISNVSHRLIKNLSKGYKQRVGLAQALLGNPEILILDEPTAGLDPKQINEIRNVIKELGKERTIILSSHILPEVSAICERVVIINNGKIVAEDTPENLSKSMTDSTSIKVRIEGEQQEVLDLLNSFEEIAKIDSSYYEDNIFDYFIETRDETDVRRKLFYALAQNKMPILMLGAHGLSLEDVFLKLTTVEQIQQPDTTENNSENSDESEQAQADI
ncbi:MAG: ATP-binding cassette domain-containing protein [Clostridiaceae bacterium]|nr:ATP-binding cassette domain-containing protein [Clostridiaceae bacterium]